MTYQAIYKCRLCGETFVDGKTDNRSLIVATMSGIIPGRLLSGKAMREANAPLTMNNAHKCADGSIGIADFQGFKAVGE